MSALIQPVDHAPAVALAERTIVVVNAIPRSGASTMAASLAISASKQVDNSHLIDAADRRHSGLRNLSLEDGIECRTSGGVFTTSRRGSLRIHHAAYRSMDARLDVPDTWTMLNRSDAPWAVAVVDLGVSAEEVLTTHPDAAAWLRDVVDPWVVMMAPTDHAGLIRADSVLTEWSHSNFPRLGAAAIVGTLPARTPPGTDLIEKLLSRSVQVPRVEALPTEGLTPAALPPSLTESAAMVLGRIGHPFQTPQIEQPATRRLLPRKRK